ncbi:histidine acid phosphatase [Podospora didyma]|uniref:Histidine acid phosphatase n=1 Tax=Podospora didyma TaxID=330526 RepID=A0AAE0NPK3_9PEZI|nr:histidine acid phosphatase [Podospora didyma]
MVLLLCTASLVSAALLAALAPAAAVATALNSPYHFDPLEHLGGVTPYFEPQDPPNSPAPPEGCTAERAAYLVRHAAIYVNDFDFEEYIDPFISKWENKTGIDWAKIPDLDFLAKWTPPVSEAEEELLTRLGKLEATQLGISLSFRYPRLRLPQRVWTSAAERTVKSAQALVRGFELRENTINVVEIYEGEESGADSLTPYKACPGYSSKAGSDESSAHLKKFTKPIVARLNSIAPGFNFTAKDVYGMMQTCGYETVVRGSSPFCSLELFTPDDWLGWEYTEDIRYHYNVGYGNIYAGAFGLPWLSAVGDLLKADTTEQDLYISFTHRELPPAVLVAMGLFNNSEFSEGGNVNDTMPLDRINGRRAWKSSHILPFLGNIAIERLNCTGAYGYADGAYYRALVNNAPQPLPECGDGPGTSCSQAGFETYLQDRAALFGGFSEKCGVEYKNSTDVLDIYTDPTVGNGTMVGKRSISSF